MKDISFYSRKFEFEIEVLARCAWKGIELSSVPVDVYYAPKDERVSHFRPFKDFFRISIVNTLLCILAFGYYIPRNTLRSFRKKSLKQVIQEDILKSSDSNFKISAAIGFGIFMGIFPVWGYQLIIGFSLAHLFKLNKSIFFIFANISLPPMIPFILYLSYLTGGIVEGKSSWLLPVPKEFSFEFVWANLGQYMIGAVVFSVIAGIPSFLISYSIFYIVRGRK
jgi:uncharacterized protein (DUF2062 family)